MMLLAYATRYEIGISGTKNGNTIDKIEKEMDKRKPLMSVLVYCICIFTRGQLFCKIVKEGGRKSLI